MVFNSSDIREMVKTSVRKVLNESIVDDVVKNFDDEVSRVCADISQPPTNKFAGL